MAKRNTLRQEYYKKTGLHWKKLNKQAKPTIEYCKWLENELLAEREQVKNNVDLHNVSNQKELLLSFSEYFNKDRADFLTIDEVDMWDEFYSAGE